MVTRSAKCIAIQLKPHQCTGSDHNAATAAVNIELSMNGAMFNVSSRPFHFMAFYFVQLAFFQSVHFIICTYLKRTAQTERKKQHHGNWKMIEKGNCWCKNASSLLNCEIGSHGVNTCHSLKKSWMHVNHIWHFCVGRFKPQIDIMLLVNTYMCWWWGWHMVLKHFCGAGIQDYMVCWS